LIEKDEEALKYLIDVKTKEDEDESGLSRTQELTLNFKENPYFTNSSLTLKVKIELFLSALLDLWKRLQYLV
jgi:hypothetical protein